jgi:hypothetical protein
VHESREPLETETDPESQAKRFDELLQRKAQIIARRIDSDTAARGAINEMQMINVTLVHLNGRKKTNFSLFKRPILVADNDRNLALEREWSVTYAMLSRLLMYMEKIKELNERAEHERDPLRLWHLTQDADGIKLAVQVTSNLL